MTSLTEEEQVGLAIAISSEDARHEQELRDRQLAEEFDRQLAEENEALWNENEALMNAIAQSSEDARREQEIRDRQHAEEIECQLSDENEALWYAAGGRERVDVGLRPQEAAAFAAYARREKYDNYGKKVRK